ncbi:unnamed protein product [Xylocopa violacea]|uniref:Uncharacterized protein n=1 Tax=Xylocopa violacea TaxID=135666 RepID=A0ABP1NJM2_XYLVO
MHLRRVHYGSVEFDKLYSEWPNFSAVLWTSIFVLAEVAIFGNRFFLLAGNFDLTSDGWKLNVRAYSYIAHRGAVMYGACTEPGYGTDGARLPTTDKILMMPGRASRSYPPSDRQAWETAD